MRVFLAVSKIYAKKVFEVLSAISPKPYVLVVSRDEEVELLSKAQGYEYVKIGDVEKLYTLEKLEEFDIAIAALDDDMLNIAVARVAKSMGIPVVVLFIHDTMNKDVALREGAKMFVNIDNFVSSNLRLLLLPDTWVVMELMPMIKLVVAIHRVAKRSVLGLKIDVLKEAVGFEDIQVFAIDKMGSFIKEKPLDIDDTVFVIGVEDRVLKAVAELEKTFRRYEQLYTLRYTETHRFGGYG